MNIRLKMCFLSVCIALFLLNACTTSVVMPTNPLYAKDDGSGYATVYVMRPTLQRTRGIADNDLTVEFGEKQLVALLSAGEYVAFKVRPGPVDVITRNEAYLTSKPEPETVWRSRNFIFNANQTYFIEAKFTQEEFRGIYFIAQAIDISKAKSFLNRIKPAGELAKAQPISAL